MQLFEDTKELNRLKSALTYRITRKNILLRQIESLKQLELDILEYKKLLLENNNSYEKDELHEDNERINFFKNKIISFTKQKDDVTTTAKVERFETVISEINEEGVSTIIPITY